MGATIPNDASLVARKGGGRQSTRRPEYTLLDTNAVRLHRLVHGLRFRSVDKRLRMVEPEDAME